jgi:hypothetical protein
MCEFRDQPALADAGIARDNQQSRPALDGAVPALEHLVELSIASHQPGTLGKPRPSMP